MYEYQQYGMGQQPQFGPQSLFGGMLGAPLGGAIGRGIGDIFGNPNLGSRIGQIAGGIGGGLLPFGADPIAAQQQQQQLQQLQQLHQMQQQQPGQLTPQGGFFGGLINQFSKPLAGAISDVAGYPGMAPVIGGALSGLGNLLPFGADAQAGGPQAVVQQLRQLQLQQQQLQQALQQVQQQAMMLQQQLAQQSQAQGQMLPQAWFGNLVGQYAQPVGSFIGSQLGNQGLGSTIGGIAGQIGRMLPFSADPWAAYQAQQAQLAGQQQTVH